MKMMRRRIALSRVGATQGEFPFAVDRWILVVECPRRLQYFGCEAGGLRVSQPRSSSGCSRGRQSRFGVTGIFSSGIPLSGGAVSRLLRSGKGTHRQSNAVFFAWDVIGVAQLKRSIVPRPTRWLGQCQFRVLGAVSHELCIDLASIRRQGGDAKDSTSLRDTRPWTRAVCQNLERPPGESRFGSVEQHMPSFPPIHSC
jgi:hypothetical protein